MTRAGEAPERPILFSGPMVQALLAGRKTQTRRVIKGAPEGAGFALYMEPWSKDHSVAGFCAGPTERSPGMGVIRCPYGRVGDRLWVRETTVNVEEHGYVGPVYAASEEAAGIFEGGLGPADDYTEVPSERIRLRPSIFMSRAASRVLLKITEVRVERLQAISQGDAISEGATSLDLGNDWLRKHMPEYVAEVERVQAIHDQMFSEGKRMGYPNPPLGPSPVERYRLLWNEINGPDSWDLNPWVWAVSFKLVQVGAL